LSRRIDAAFTSSRHAQGNGCANCAVSEPFTLRRPLEAAATAGVASAQIGRHDAVQWQAPDANSYKQGTNNQDTSNLRYGHVNDYR
jgi:hypothetical protein